MDKNNFDISKAFETMAEELFNQFQYKSEEIKLATYSKLDPECAKMTLSELEKMADETDKAIDSGHLTASSTSSWATASSLTSTVRPRRSLSMPDFAVPLPTTTIRTRKSFSNQRTVQPSRVYEKEVYQTPMTSSASNDMNIITPKVNIHKPVAIMRKPFEGEQAISLRGSPLMIDRLLSDKKANINIPLSDGRVMCVLPVDGLRKSQVPELDSETINELRALRRNIDLAIKRK